MTIDVDFFDVVDDDDDDDGAGFEDDDEATTTVEGNDLRCSTVEFDFDE